MLWRVIYNEHTKIFKRRMFWVEIVLMGFLVLGFQIALFAVYDGATLPADERAVMSQMITLPNALVNILNYSGGDALGGVFLSILVGAITAQEYTWRTMHLWLSRGIPRILLVTGKFAALFLPALSFVLIAVSAGVVISAIFSQQIHGSLDFEVVDFFHLAYSIIRTTCTLLPYGALAFLLAIASRSAVVAISGGLAYVLLIEDILTQILGLLNEPFSQINSLLIGPLTRSLVALNQWSAGSAINIADGSMSPFNAAVGIGIWTFIFLGLSLFIFRRQDLSE